jgi:RNA recognition motif-containing protein
MTKRLYVGNLSYNVSEQELRTVFGEIGTVTDAKVVMDRDTGRPRGFAFVEMETAEAARSAIESLDGRDLAGRTMNVKEAQERASRPQGGGFGGGRGGGGGGRW